MKKLIPFCFILLFVYSCVTTTTVVVDYASISVPEEGGLKFTEYTTDEDNVISPSVAASTNQLGNPQLQWWAAPMIAISNKGDMLSYLAFQNQTVNVYLKKTLGGNAVVQRTFRTSVNDMAFSPDDKYIAFSDNTDGNANVYMINATEGAAIQQITSTSANEVGPCYSPDNKNIFFTKYENTQMADGTYRTRYYVWSFNKESSLLTQYTEGFTPSVLPDGKSVLVTRNNKETGNGEIWLIDIDKGTESLLISDRERGFSSPQVAPDGKKVVCVGITNETLNRPINLDIYTFNIDGTKLTQLTFHGGHDLSPKWSPDGNEIYFLSQRGSDKGAFNVWKMNYKTE
jgi:Tol biopolymer transport system component